VLKIEIAQGSRLQKHVEEPWETRLEHDFTFSWRISFHFYVNVSRRVVSNVDDCCNIPPIQLGYNIRSGNM
jgi:hypothetical protein